MNEDIERIVKEIVLGMGCSCKGVSLEETSLGAVYQVESTEASLLIGIEGANLAALNHIAKKIVEKKWPDARFAVDVNGYQRARNEEITRKARMLAERVRAFQSDIGLEPMSPYERMVFHAALASEANVTTESAGTGKGRHIVIKYKA